ncbi:hypothetical protein FHW69_001965 [Luteibacter sp. Sphag1AF]|uniref:hypothetical protein n=1 Tax=Luteibacter sp. Sphag1AF TaxID=2587031 RepID=UPI001622BB80|nr:hypothetical protein [Luteibacter sp. Sphag1AF]MBB3227342.1 hypothetical protein [Luteibacter sp. Sphag1AF]
MWRQFTVFLGFCVAVSAHASSPGAWSADDAAIQKACVQASGLKSVKPVGQIIRYDDRVPVAALVLEGIYPQKHMAGRKGRELCVFDRKARQAYVSEADQLLR